MDKKMTEAMIVSRIFDGVALALEDIVKEMIEIRASINALKDATQEQTQQLSLITRAMPFKY